MPTRAPFDWLLVDRAERIVDWSKAGVWSGGIKGIPNYPVGITVNTTTPTHQYYCDPTGVVDCRAKLKAALDACPKGSAVYLPAGLYRTNATILMPNRVALRGAGPTLTTIKCYYDGDAVYMSGSMNEQPSNIVSGYAKGSTQIVVASGTNFATGDLVIIDQLNDPSFVNIVGSEDTCTWCDRYDTGTRALGEMNRIVSKSVNTLNLELPLLNEYSGAYVPRACPIGKYASGGVAESAGVEDLAITHSNPSWTNTVAVHFHVAYGCWVKRCNLYGQAHKGVWLYGMCLACEVRDSYIHDFTQFDSDHGYPIGCQYQSSYNLFENNIIKMGHGACIFGSAGSAGNVVGYNYVHSTKHYQTDWFIQAFGDHGAHPFMNLFEGNIVGKFAFDFIHGSGSHEFVFRNHVTGQNPEVAVTSNLSAIEVESWHYKMSFVGNALTYPGNPNAPWLLTSQSLTLNSMLRHGNYDFATGSTAWDGTISARGIPSSLYLNAKPAWFGSLVWPTIGPDIVGFVKPIPAKARWDKYVISGNVSELF